MRHPLALLALLAALAVPAGCSSGNEEVPYVERSAEEIYNEAAEALEDEDYEQAAQLFDEVERQHPYSPWAQRAQLMSAFAHYQDLNYDEAIIALDRFIRLHPGSDQVPYAFYLRALSFYERISDVERDQSMTEEALQALTEVERRFPETAYARDAALKRDLTLDQLAGQEMSIGRFYLHQNQYHAAINRFQRVVERFETTTHVPEALHRLTESYLALGLTDQARTTAAVLGHNFPGSDWYLDSYALLIDDGVRPPDDSTMLSRTLDWVF
ncbi:MAG: outer membrane protein assembly factor BamD [Alphaproteobacteria bacterium]|jgi:outer membrane protein assembly factor BamD|nr:outer membrane protein assembly factor BamD [Alphaproteobacteria bacterium]